MLTGFKVHSKTFSSVTAQAHIVKIGTIFLFNDIFYLINYKYRIINLEN